MMPIDPLSEVRQVFEQQFRCKPALIARAPGRVNLIGEHTDYNGGFVLPLAIDRSIWLAAQPRTDSRVIIHALDFGRIIEFDLNQLEKSASGVAAYVQSMAWVLKHYGFLLSGFEGVLKGNIPIGAGLSSSAALELVIARTFAAFSQLEWEPMLMASLAQKAENDWVGVNCGIMDQLISAAGKKGSALLIDCRSLDCEPVHLPAGASVVVMDTATRRGATGLIDSAYNDRRRECELAAQILGVTVLRDATLDLLQSCADVLGSRLYRRARHVITENERTLAAHRAMLANDAAQLGNLINQSHTSLRDDFEVSSHALNLMVDLAREQSGCYGARMSGGGFAGCAIALVETARTADFIVQVSTLYQAQTSLEPSIFLCEAVDGASLCG